MNRGASAAQVVVSVSATAFTDAVDGSPLAASGGKLTLSVPASGSRLLVTGL